MLDPITPVSTIRRPELIQFCEVRGQQLNASLYPLSPASRLPLGGLAVVHVRRKYMHSAYRANTIVAQSSLFSEAYPYQ